jgi:hypothetical protein
MAETVRPISSAPANAVRVDQTPTEARSKLAVAHRGGEPDAATKRLLKANLACSVLDAKVRQQLADADLLPVHVEHIIGLLLMESGVDGATVTLVSKLARDAVEAGQK